MTTLYWHDYETWGANPSVDRPAQFAGVRTDEELTIIGEPLNVYCQPAEDVLPHPEACLVTGIAPQTAQEKGLKENEFIARVHEELAQPGTCGVGYNSIRFDDEVTRYTLYRNFFDPYAREWQNGNGRWDLIDTARLCYALRPQGIEWPVVDGKPSFRLERLTEANGIGHAAAHNALSDVEATIALARLIKRAQPALYDYTWRNRAKRAVSAMVDLRQRRPLLHISAMFPAIQGCAALVMPLAVHPVNKNAIMVFDLSADPRPLLELSAEEVARRVYTANDELAEGEERIPLKLIHLNKCPVLLTPKILDADAQRRLGIDKTRCERHWQTLLQYDLSAKLQAAIGEQSFPERLDPEQKLYDGFITDADKKVMAQVRQAGAAEFSQSRFLFADQRLADMLPRYQARNFPDTLSSQQRNQWREFCADRLSEGGEGCLSIAQVRQRIAEIDGERSLDKAQKILLQQLFRYTSELERKYQIGPKCRW